MNNNQDYVQWFRHASPYINAHRNKTFVVMLPGEALAHANFSNIIHDIALLNSLGVRLVLVHGARPQIDKNLCATGAKSGFHRNLRISDNDSLHTIIQAIGETRILLEAALSAGQPNSPMHGSQIPVISGNFVSAMPHGVLDGIDLQHTGKVRKIDVEQLSKSLDAGSIVVLSPLGYSATGEVFNLAYTDVASHAAIALRADKLLAFNAVDGVLNEEGKLIRQFSLNECQHYLEKHHASMPLELHNILQTCYQGCLNGVQRAQLINYSKDGALLNELFTRDGLGTMVHSDQYEQLRTATINDVGGILGLIEPLEVEGVLVRRSRERLEAEIKQFTVLEKDGTIIACAAVYPYDDTAELSCVATHTEYRKGGRAALLLSHIEEHAKKSGIKRLFVLTTQTAHWFLEHGFIAGEMKDLPSEKKSLYNLQRNSKIFFKALT